MKVLDVVLIVLLAAALGFSLRRREWLAASAVLLCITCCALDLAGIGGPLW